MSQIDIQSNPQLQSPYLFCQSVGSDESDGTNGGAHIRWDFMKELGYNHIPKGNSAGNNDGFNKNEDFVTLYRSQYITDRMTTVDLTNIDFGNISYLENYAGLTYTVPMGNFENTIIVRFSDRGKFKLLLEKGLDPSHPVQDFLNQYNGIIEIEVENKLVFFYASSFIDQYQEGTGMIETISTADRHNNKSVQVVKRDIKNNDELISEGLGTTAENIKMIRLRPATMIAPHIVQFYTYEDLFDCLQENDAWTEVGKFSLSLDDNEVFTWLESNTGNLTWPKYNDGALVQAQNYRDRWNHNVDGLKTVVEEYINLSNNDPRAITNFPSQNPDDPNTLTVSLLDMLKMVSLDYHAARMLGLGYLDEIHNYEGGTFVYAAVYFTIPELPNIGSEIDHIFLTLPTSKTDYRLPVAPELSAPSYGLYVQTNEGDEPVLISDANGYSHYENVRFINLNKQNLHAPQPVLRFIPEEVFDASNITQPAAFGIEYKERNESEWRNPEILHDEEYADQNGIHETVFTPERETNPLYTHREFEEGSHTYALYAINWFSRVSERSNTHDTNLTLFRKKNTLLPPFNLGVQYIQEEDPLMFTTQSEQAALTNANNTNPNGDNNKTRVTFDWNNIHNNSYQRANTIQFFFREMPIKKVEGQVSSVTSISDTECIVFSKSLQIASQNPPLIISPAIAPADVSKFIGSLLNTPEGQFKIVSISQPGNTPSFRVKKLVATEIYQATPDDPMITSNVYTEPKVSDAFFIWENISELAQWTMLSKTVEIVEFSNVQELITEEDGSTHTETVGGINEVAVISEISFANNPTGGYRVEFNNYTLEAHPDPDEAVSWVKGSARFILENNAAKKKALPVVSIEQTSPLIIIAYDPDYFTYPNERIQTVGGLLVNYHPGYKVYLSSEAGVFDKIKLLPSGTANNKKTFIAARSMDAILNYGSSLTPPVTLVARSIQKPVTPEAITGALFATRPDFYGRSTYTLDIQLNTTNRFPYGLVVYRANEMAILQALYTPQTVPIILNDLAAIAGNDPLKFNRWRSLVEVEIDITDTNKFRLFGSYRFPNPDNESTEVFISATASIRPFPLSAGETLTTKKAIIKKTIEDVFSSLTETPIIFSFLKAGYQTSSEQPKTKSIIGRLLNPTDPSFNPYPMAVKFPVINPNNVRFTDYSINGNSRNIYFYFAREVSVDAKFSDRTPVSGPVILVDASPAEKPTIRKTITQEANPILNKPASVLFDLTEYIDAERIKQYQVFRTTNFANAATTRTMQLAATLNVGDSVADNFTDLSFPPYGQPLFYRVVALREIINEREELEMIPSLPSEVVLTNVIDVINPVAPEITPTIGGTQTNGTGQITALTNVSLSWPGTTYNGTYTLYKMNIKGNWEKLWSKKTNNSIITFPENGDFVAWPQTANLSKLDEDGNVIYHRFKVSVENANGLFNLEDQELVI